MTTNINDNDGAIATEEETETECQDRNNSSPKEEAIGGAAQMGTTMTEPQR